MLKASTLPNVSDKDAGRKRLLRPPNKKRAQSISPTVMRSKRPEYVSKIPDRRCHSLTPSVNQSKESLNTEVTPALEKFNYYGANQDKEPPKANEKDPVIPQCVVTKLMRALATKRREYTKLRKTVIAQQNSLLEHCAAVKELEARVGLMDENSTGDVRIVSVSGWPAHDLLLLVRDDLDKLPHSDISGVFGSQILQQIHAQLNSIPEDVLEIGAEITSRRIDLLNELKGKHRGDRAGSYLNNSEWKTKCNELDQETDRLQALVEGLVEDLKAKVNCSLYLSKLSWLDRETLIKKLEKIRKENLVIQNRIDELSNKEQEGGKQTPQLTENSPKYQTMSEELAKEKAAREALKDLVSSAESMLRVARSRISTLERQLKESKAELDASKKKQKDLEQLYRHRETSYDARSRKLLEVSKTGEMTIETLSRQRDALELRFIQMHYLNRVGKAVKLYAKVTSSLFRDRVKELREQAEVAEKQAEARNAEQKKHADSLNAKVAEQEKVIKTAEARIQELEAKVKEVEDQYQALKERSVKLVDMERRRCLEYVPSKEAEPSDRETEIWKELQVTRVALSRAEEELRQSRADKDNLLNSLDRIAQGEDAESFKNKMVMELLEREQSIVKLQHVIEELRDNEKLMEQSMTQYENQLAALRLEVKRLRNYDCYAKEIPYQELHTELLELHMQVETLSRERSALITAAASRALMLERHERSAELFSRMVRARRDLAALIDGRTEPPAMDDVAHAEVSRSLSSVCASAADTWSALRAERARVLRLESAVLSQSAQLEREGRVRTQLERRRTVLERDLLRAQHSVPFADNTLSLIYCVYVTYFKETPTLEREIKIS